MLRTLARVVLPAPARQHAYRLAMRARHAGMRRQCPVCLAHLHRFVDDGDPPRPEARCPVCDAMERHRLLWCYFREQTDILQGSGHLLHVAPELCFVARLRRALGARYVTLDLSSSADVRGDLLHLPWRDATFRVVYCSHVLEHVPDDQGAMRELRRVLHPDGYAILQVPMRPGKTFEDPTITTPEERYRVFGQDDHVRIYGDDYPDRLRAAGWTVTEDRYAFGLSPEFCSRHGIVPEVIIRARPR